MESGMDGARDVVEQAAARERTRGLVRRIAERISSGTTDVAPAPYAEDVADFLSPARFERERRKLFLETPQVVGFAGEVAAPSSYLAVESMGIPIVVTRDHEGRLHAFVNACAHRGARVARGHGVAAGRRLRCGFHGWTFGLDGKLASRPSDACFERATPADALTALPVSDRGGLLVVGLTPEVPQARVDAHLDGIAGELGGLGLERAMTLDSRRYDVAASWKLVSLLSCESYHFATLHRDTVATMFAPNAIADFFGRHSRWAFALKGTEREAAASPPAADRVRSEAEAGLESDGASALELFPGALSHQIFPGTIVITTWEIAQLIRSEPGPTPGSAVIHYSGVYFDESKREALRENYALGLKAFETEDLPAALETHQGLAAGRARLFAGTNEPVVQFWLRQWRDGADA